MADKVIALAQELISTSKSSSTKRKHESDSSRDKDSKKSRSDKDKYDSKDTKERDRDSKHEEKEKESKSEENGKEKEKKSILGNGVDVPVTLRDGDTVGSKISGLSSDRIKVGALFITEHFSIYPFGSSKKLKNGISIVVASMWHLDEPADYVLS